MGEKKWYVVNTHSGYEKKAKIALIERITSSGMADKFGEPLDEAILIPVETVLESKKGGERKQTERKFFPGYILINMEMNNHTWHLVKSTPKISGFVGGGTTPPAMPDAEVNRIKSQINESAAEPDLLQTLDEGDNVRVTDGPFSNFNGVVEAVDRDRGRLRVLVSIFGRVVPVELEFGQVERVVT